MSRADGRNADELRQITVVYERLDRVDGSARFGFGKTQSIASVSGPIEVRPNLESPSQSTLDIHVRPLASAPGTDSRAVASILKTALAPSLLLSQHPRTLVQLVGQALCGSDSGSGTGNVGRSWNATLIATLVNASSAALINASSVPMCGIVCAVAVGRLWRKDAASASLILDPSESELSHLVGGGCFAFLFSSTVSCGKTQGDIPSASLLWRNYAATDGVFDEEEFSRAQQLALKGAQRVWRTLKESIVPGAILSTMRSRKESASAGPAVVGDDNDDDEVEI